MWGFLNAIAPMGLMLLAGICFFLPPVAYFFAFLASCSGCSGLAWYIAGLCWRFRASGKFASGDSVPEDQRDAWIETVTAEDYAGLSQYSSGNFMYVYYLITWILMGISCGCMLIGMIAACACGVSVKN